MIRKIIPLLSQFPSETYVCVFVFTFNEYNFKITDSKVYFLIILSYV